MSTRSLSASRSSAAAGRVALPAAFAIVLACGCAPTDYENGVAPHLVVDGPAGSNEMGYWGADFAVDWSGVGLDLTVASRSEDTMFVSFTPMLRLGWLLTGYPQASVEDNYWWIVFKLGWGAYTWGETDSVVGVCSVTKAGFGCHLNDFNTIGLEYSWVSLGATGDYEDSAMEGLYLMYSLEF